VEGAKEKCELTCINPELLIHKESDK
jgi:hypothetical protein